MDNYGYISETLKCIGRTYLRIVNYTSLELLEGLSEVVEIGKTRIYR